MGEPRLHEEVRDRPQQTHEGFKTPHPAWGVVQVEWHEENLFGESSEEERVVEERSMRRSGSIRGQDSIRESREPVVPPFQRSQSQRLLQQESLLLRRYLEENLGEAEDRPIIPRPNKPMFVVDEDENPRVRVLDLLELNRFHRDYNMLHRDVRRDISFSSYLELLGVKEGMHGQRHSGGLRSGKELQHKIGKLQIPSFDGKKMTIRVWVHQLQTYLVLNPSMTEEEAINFASLHFDGDALEWWRHGMSNQGYGSITSFKEFTRQLVKKFDQKWENNYFWDLNALRQTNTVDEFVVEFQRLAVMIHHIPEERSTLR